ncbi:MAG: class IV adenylate cyclase, partial [Candidatus Pacearchaeota archaeon]
MVKEIELKFRIESYREFILKLLKAGALFENSKYEVTIMYDENNKLFEKDARLRLRKKFDVFTNEEEAEISYKKPLTREGIKIEEEYETKVENFKEIEEILTNIGFKKVSSYERVRDTYRFEEIKITVDSFSFGDYV